MPKRAKKKAEPNEAAEKQAVQPVPDEPEVTGASRSTSEGDTEVHTHADMPAPADEGVAEASAEAADTFEQAFEERSPSDRKISLPPELRVSEGSEETEPLGDQGAEPAEKDGFTPAERPPARLERLQKILSQAGIASRRHAEEMITQGRVQVNGKVVTELGSKADPQRDHIRVDGKLLHGAERLRYFALNKPRGYVTTVSDPEGRPTVMQFFQKMNERLYPVGRLDYQSEGLLLVTNDGDLANKLTRPASGVEKTYLVKVSGRPRAEELEQLRAGLAIDRTRPGEGRIWTAPATVTEVRSGDNPWYQVVITEGRNRELRKMFEEIGHHVEKIRRVGYGPLVLDLEPGRFRELELEEVNRLRLASEGKWRKPKPKEDKQRGQARSQEFTRRRSDEGRRPEERSRRAERPRPEQPRDRGARVDRDAFHGRPGQKTQGWSREDRRQRDRRTATSGQNATPSTPAGGQDQAWSRRRDDRASGQATGRHYGQREDPRQADGAGERPRRGGPKFGRAGESRKFQGGSSGRPGTRPGPRGSAGSTKFEPRRAEKGFKDRTAGRSGSRQGQGGMGGEGYEKRYPAAGQRRPGPPGERRAHSSRYGNRRPSSPGANSPRSSNRPRGPRGNRS